VQKTWQVPFTAQMIIANNRSFFMTRMGLAIADILSGGQDKSKPFSSAVKTLVE
jgi:hypothetical protein